MTSKDSFPATSLGRSLGTRLQGSSDSLSHPLLSAAPPPPPTSGLSPLVPTHARRTSDQSIPHDPLGTTTKYVPYTPRHRAPPPSSPTTSTSVQSAPSVLPVAQQGAGATGKLQVQNLKAAAQAIGLGNGSVGWAILERFTSEAELVGGPSWNEAWNLVSTGKASLLLPTEPLSGSLDTALGSIKDHVVFSNGPSASQAPLITQSGLRGIVEGDILTFRSTIPVTSTIYARLLNISTRSSALLSAPPLPHPLSPAQTASFPTYAIPNYTATLPCPPRHVISPVPPPLPARPGTTRGGASQANPAIIAPSASAASRLNPFASLFGRPSTPSIATLPISPSNAPPSASIPRPNSPQPSISSVNSVDGGLKPDLVSISVFVVDRAVKRKQVLKDIQKGTKVQIKESLGSAGLGLPNWVVTRVVDFSALLYEMYFNANGRAGEGSPASDTAESGTIRSLRLSSRGKNDWTPDLSTHATTSESFQSFFSALEEDVAAYWNAAGSPTTLTRRKPEAQASLDEKDASRSTKEEKRIADKERQVRDTMDAVENILCSLFYDRLFAPEGSDDKSHDEALAGRVAALNMLDLTLEHLGVEAGLDALSGVEKVIQAVGRELQRLEDPLCRGPCEKAAVLVAAHNVIVEGLAKLPPISLKPDTEPSDEMVDTDKTPMAPSFPESAVPSNTGQSSSSATKSTSESLAVPSAITVAEPSTSDTTSEASISVSTGETDATIATSAEPAPDVLATMKPSAPASTPVSSDILLPMLIYSVVKSNPTQLVSHVLYIQRYRHRSAAGGEAGFCLINTMAVAEFLENVDMAALGLTESDRVSVADLDPIPLPGDAPTLSQPNIDNLPARLRGKVEQQVGELAGSANKVISGVVDSSFSALRGLLGGDQTASGTAIQTATVLDENPRQGFGLLRRASGFSIASVARLRSASISANLASAEEGGQQMMEVPSRPGSLRSVHHPDGSSGEETSSEGDENESDSGEEEDGEDAGAKSDVRSIRSFGSMFSEAKDEGRPRKSLTDRLANVSARLTVNSPSRGPDSRRLSPPGSRRTSLLVTSPKSIPIILSNDMPSGSSLNPIPPPNPRFLDCDVNDLKISEISALLQEYRRLADALKSRGAFQDAFDLSNP